MDSYLKYYDFVVNVSGSFTSYSAQKQTLKQDFAFKLKSLELYI